MLIKIYDQDGNYEVDTINLDNYDIENTPEEFIDLLIDIIESYKEESDD